MYNYTSNHCTSNTGCLSIWINSIYLRILIELIELVMILY